MYKLSEKKVTIILPCFNEQDNLVILFKKIATILIDVKVEYLFIDDNSNDNSLTIIEELSRNNNNVKFISFSRNFGHQKAIRAGLEYSTGDCVIMMDADLQHPPDLLPKMLEKWIQGYDIVYTIRKESGDVTNFKKITSRLFYKLFNFLADFRITPGAADFRLIDKKIVRILVDDFTEYHLFYRGIISWLGFTQIGIPYTSESRLAGNSKYSLKKMILFALDGITSSSIKPLRIAIIIGFLLSLSSGIYAIYALFIAYFSDEVIKGWTSILLSILFIGGINMILLGIISEYLGKLFIQSKKRPHFLIKKTNINA